MASQLEHLLFEYSGRNVAVPRGCTERSAKVHSVERTRNHKVRGACDLAMKNVTDVAGKTQAIPASSISISTSPVLLSP